MTQVLESINRRRNELSFNETSIKTIKENKENITLVWFDPNLAPNEDYKEKSQELRVINDCVAFFSDLEKCITFIKSVQKEKIFLITSGSKASEILPRISDVPLMDSIFIFCIKKDLYEPLLTEYQKIVSIHINRDDLFKSIRKRIAIVNKYILTFSLMDQHQQSIMNLSEESAKFHWYQLFKHFLTNLPRNQQAKQEMIQFCKEYYRGNTNEMKYIQEFEQKYQSEDAIHWYSKQIFLYKIINKALRTADIELLHTFRFFIVDLSENLRLQHEKILISREKVLNVYRGVRLDKNEFNKLKENQGKLISTNGYLSTSRDESQARSYANKDTKRSDAIHVLFHIQVDIEQINKNIVFADIAELSDNPKEAEVLFDINACFEIESFQEENESLPIMNMKLSNEGQKAMKDFIELTKRETEGMSDSIAFGKLLCDLGEYDKSQKYFQQLLDDSNKEDRAWIEFNIGRALDFKDKRDQARDYYNRAYVKMMNSKPPRIKDSAHVLNNIGCILLNQGKYDEALNCHQRVLEIRKNYFPSDHVNIAQSLNNIGNVFFHQEKYNKALDYYQQASKIYEKFYTFGHIDLADTLNNIGVCYKTQNQRMALNYFERALKLYERFLPINHASIQRTKDTIHQIIGKN